MVDKLLDATLYRNRKIKKCPDCRVYLNSINCKSFLVSYNLIRYDHIYHMFVEGKDREEAVRIGWT